MYKILPLAIIILLIILAFVVLKKLYMNPRNSKLKVKRKSRAKGIIFGKTNIFFRVFSPTDNEGHVAVFGGSGLGKTSALLIPTLRSWTGTSFTIDISGDICSNVEMPNKLIYEPANPNSSPYNIFGAIDQLEEESDKNEALEKLAFLLMPDSVNMSDASMFFNAEGRKILTASLIAFYNQGMDFIQICEEIVHNSWKSLFNKIDDTENEKAMQFINSFHGTSEQNTAGCKQSVDSVLKLFATNERIKKNIHRPKENEIAYTPNQLETHNVFIIIDDSNLKLYAPILHIISVQSLEYFSTRSNQSKTTILFALDEFASLGKMDITDALRKLRKKHIRIMVLTQSMADIDLIYGENERKAMMNNFPFKVILGADDTDTQEYFAKLIGYEKTTKKSTTKGAQKSYTESESKEYAIDPEELSRFQDDLVLLYPGGFRRLTKNYYFK